MTEEHIVTSFDDELTELTDGLVNLGNLAQVALSNVEMALKTNDHNLRLIRVHLRLIPTPYGLVCSFPRTILYLSPD